MIKAMFTGFVSQHHYVAVAGPKTTVNVANASRSLSPPVQLRLLNITFEPEVFVGLEYAIANPEYIIASVPQLRARVNNLPLLDAPLVLILPRITSDAWLALMACRIWGSRFPMSRSRVAADNIGFGQFRKLLLLYLQPNSR